jgi:hypothetical protein
MELHTRVGGAAAKREAHPRSVFDDLLAGHNVCDCMAGHYVCDVCMSADRSKARRRINHTNNAVWKHFILLLLLPLIFVK